ncbi:transposase, partial [Streptomyces olivoreticuli]
MLAVCAIELEDLLPQLAAVQVETVEAGGDLVRITARTRAGVLAVCPGCGKTSDWEHSRYVRHVADEAVGGRPVMIGLSVRRLYCENPDCSKQAFAEQIAGLTVRYQRRTPALQAVVEAVARALAGAAGARLLLHLHQVLSWATMPGCLLRIPLPERPVPRVPGIDEFALRRGKRYATILIDAKSGQRIDVLPDRTMESVTAWLREHRGVEIACRDGALDFAQAVAQADPAIAQCMDRWHLWRAWPRRRGRRSPRTASAGPRSALRCPTADGPRPPANAGTRLRFPCCSGVADQLVRRGWRVLRFVGLAVVCSA